MTRVRNIRRGNGLARCACGTWKQHWINHAGSRRTRCSVAGCGSNFDVGAHVRLAHGNAANNHYIVPMCTAHNNHNNTAIMELNDIDLIYANAQYMGCNPR